MSQLRWPLFVFSANVSTRIGYNRRTSCCLVDGLTFFCSVFLLVSGFLLVAKIRNTLFIARSCERQCRKRIFRRLHVQVCAELLDLNARLFVGRTMPLTVWITKSFCVCRMDFPFLREERELSPTKCKEAPLSTRHILPFNVPIGLGLASPRV